MAYQCQQNGVKWVKTLDSMLSTEANPLTLTAYTYLQCTDELCLLFSDKENSSKFSLA